MYSLLPPLYFFFLLDTLLLLSSCRHEGVRSALPGLRGLIGVSSPSRRPCGALLSFGEFLSYLYFASAVSDIFVINVINNIRISLYYIFLRDMCCVILVEYKLCTHPCLQYTFSSCSFGDTLLLLSSCRHEGVRSALPGLRGLLGIRLPVGVPVAPCFSFGESYSYFCTSLPLYQTFCH